MNLDEKKSRADSMSESIGDHPVSMALSDPNLDDNPLVYVNGAFEKITLYSSEAALGRNCRFLQCENTDQDTTAALREAIKAERDVTVDILNRKADGTEFMNRLVVSPVRDENGKVQAFLGIQSELTGEHLQADRSDRDDRTMLHELQHRVKNHLSMVVGMIRMQSRREVTRESFEALSHRIQSLALLYEELNPNGAVSRDADMLMAGAYLSRVAATLGAIDGRAAIRVNVDCEDIELDVETGARLGMLLTELMTNALEHAFEGRDEGVVRVRFQRQTNGHVRLTVEDDGIGLPQGSNWPENAPSVERQTERTEKETGELHTRGTKRASGMGGSIVTAMIDALDGDLSVTSSDFGTTVVVDLNVDHDKSGTNF